MTIRNDASRLRIPGRDPRATRGVVARQGQVLLDADFNAASEQLLARVEAETADVMGAAGRLVVPAGTSGFAITPDGAPGNFTIGAGDAYLGGWRLGNSAPCKLGTQPHPRSAAGVAAPVIVALKALIRHIDPAENPGLADVALGDAQAAGRALADWQVLPVAAATSAATPLSCATALTDANWAAMVAPSTGKLAFIARAAGATTDPCSLTPGGGYARYENLLYRIEVHGGAVATTTADNPRYALNGLKLKLSRRNASVMVRITGITANRISVTPPALDPRNWFAPGSYAEIVSIHDDVDPAAAQANERLFQVALTDDDSVTLVEGGGATVAATGANSGGDWFLRLWDALPAGTNGALVGAATVVAAGSDSQVIDLGDGLTIQLTGGAAARFRRGDYWTCAARADGSIAWSVGALAAIAETPHGPEVRYAPLAVLTATGLEDCRIPAASLTDRSLLYRGGDGQSMPLGTPAGLVPLLAKLRVAVMRGQTPVAGAKIRWDFVAPAAQPGTLTEGANVHASGFEATTDANGLSEVSWAIDPAAPDVVHQAQASLAGSPLPATPPIIFSARFHADTDHVGCSTLVIEEGSDWVETLKNIDTNQDLAICFQRGRFNTREPVELRNGINIRMSGAGDGTVITCTRGEHALLFDQFDSVTLHGLRVETLDRPHRILPDKAHRRGTVTILNTQIVDVSEMTLRCGGDVAPQRTCLTVAGDPARPTRLARIMRNRILAGFLQDGILVTDCAHTRIADNELVATRRSEALGDQRIIHDKAWQRAAAAALISNLRSAEGDSEPDFRVLKFGALEARFISAAPQAEWDAMAAAMPFVSEGEVTPDMITAHIVALAKRGVSDGATGPATVKRFAAHNRLLMRDLTREQSADAVSFALLPAGIEVSVAPSGKRGLGAARRPGKSLGGVTIEGGVLRFGRVAITFDSPVALGAWRALIIDTSINDHGAPENLGEASDLLEAIARRMVADTGLRAKHRAVAEWYDLFAMPVPAVARQAITCGGGTLGDVSITGNRAEGFIEGTHVGASVSDDTTRGATNARISDNDFYLRKPSSVHYAPCALFVGNVETGRIDRNLIAHADANPNGRHRHGIRVWGYIGHYLMISQNRIDLAELGIRVESITPISPKLIDDYLWVAADNLVGGVSRPNVIYASAPMQDRDNRPT